mgnify:CR=1 FL=1
MERKHSSHMTIQAASAQSRRAGTLWTALFPPARSLQGRFPYLRRCPGSCLLPGVPGDLDICGRGETPEAGLPPQPELAASGWSCWNNTVSWTAKHNGFQTAAKGARVPPSFLRRSEIHFVSTALRQRVQYWCGGTDAGSWFLLAVFGICLASRSGFAYNRQKKIGLLGGALMTLWIDGQRTETVAGESVLDAVRFPLV